MNEHIKNVFQQSALDGYKKNIVEEPCLDSYIGNYEKDNYYIPKYTLSNDRTLIFGKKIGEIDNEEVEHIVIILESPHIDEFFKKPYLPAQGATGIFLKGYLSELLFQLALKDFLPADRYRIFLINSIQYQCSLGQPTEFFRDYVWEQMWANDEVREDFERRIEQVHPSIIINLCTDSKEARRDKVQESIENAFKSQQKIKFFMGNHPSSWGRNCNNRYIYESINAKKTNKIKF